MLHDDGLCSAKEVVSLCLEVGELEMSLSLCYNIYHASPRAIVLNVYSSKTR